MAAKPVANKTLAKAAEEYLEKLTLADSTIDARRRALQFLMISIGVPAFLVRDITDDHIAKLRADYRTTWTEPGTRNLYRLNLGLFFKYCRRKGYCPPDWDPLFMWEAEKVNRHKPKFSVPGESEDLERYLDAARSPLHRAIFAFMWGTSLRPSDGKVRRWYEVDWTGKEHPLGIPSISASIQKTKDHDRKVFTELMWRELNAWHENLRATYKRHGIPWSDGYYIFPAVRGAYSLPEARIHFYQEHRFNPGEMVGMIYLPDRPIGEFGRMIKDTLVRAGYPASQRMGGGTTRRSSARMLRKAGVSMSDLSTHLNHAGEGTTKIYLSEEEDRMRRDALLGFVPPKPEDPNVIPIFGDRAKSAG